MLHCLSKYVRKLQTNAAAAVKMHACLECSQGLSEIGLYPQPVVTWLYFFHASYSFLICLYAFVLLPSQDVLKLCFLSKHNVCSTLSFCSLSQRWQMCWTQQNPMHPKAPGSDHIFRENNNSNNNECTFAFNTAKWLGGNGPKRKWMGAFSTCTPWQFAVGKMKFLSAKWLTFFARFPLHTKPTEPETLIFCFAVGFEISRALRKQQQMEPQGPAFLIY